MKCCRFNRHTRAAQSGKFAIAISILLLGVVVSGFLLRALMSIPQLPEHATVLPTPAPLANFALANHEEQPFTRDSLRGHWSMIFFGFTNCPDICPLTLHKLAQARDSIARSDPDAPLPEIVFISVDPDRDSTESLKQYVQSFGTGVTGVRGEHDELAKLTKPLGIFFNVDQTDDKNTVVDHSAAVIVVNENAEFHALFSAPHQIDAFASDMQLIMASK